MWLPANKYPRAIRGTVLIQRGYSRIVSSVRCEDEDLDTRDSLAFHTLSFDASLFITAVLLRKKKESLWQAPSSRIERMLQALKRGVP